MVMIILKMLRMLKVRIIHTNSHSHSKTIIECFVATIASIRKDMNTKSTESTKSTKITKTFIKILIDMRTIKTIKIWKRRNV